MKKYDIVIDQNGSKQVVSDVYVDTLNQAIENAITLIGGGEYCGHTVLRVRNGAWVVIEECQRYGDHLIFTDQGGEILVRHVDHQECRFIPVQFGSAGSAKRWIDAL